MTPSQQSSNPGSLSYFSQLVRLTTVLLTADLPWVIVPLVESEFDSQEPDK